MTVTISLDIRDAVMTALNTDTPTGIPMATKRRVMPGEPVREPFIAVFLGREQVTHPGGSRGPIADRPLEVLIELGTATDDLANVDDLIEPLRAWLVKALGDSNLGGLASEVQELGVTERATYKLDLYNALAITAWTVRYQTARADLAARQ